MATGSWRSILLIFFFAELIAACHGKSLMLVNDVSRQFGVSAPEASWVIGSVAVVAAIFSPVGGWAIDRIGELRAIRIGLVIALLASFVSYFAQSYPVLIFARGVEGIGYIAVVLAALSLLIRTTEGKRQTTALALWSVASPMGGALAIILVSPLVGKPNWQLVFAIHSFLLFGALFLTPLLPKAPPRTASPPPLSQALSVYGFAKVRIFLFAILFVQIYKLGAGSALPTFLMEHHHIPPHWIGLLSSVGILLSVGGGIVAGWLFNRGHSPASIAIGASVISGLTSAVIFAKGIDLPPVLAAMLISSISGGVMFAWITSAIPTIVPDEERTGATAGAVSQLLYLSMAVGPSIMFFILAQPSQLPLLLFILLSYGLPVLLLHRQRAAVSEAAPA